MVVDEKSLHLWTQLLGAGVSTWISPAYCVPNRTRGPPPQFSPSQAMAAPSSEAQVKSLHHPRFSPSPLIPHRICQQILLPLASKCFQIFLLLTASLLPLWLELSAPGFECSLLTALPASFLDPCNLVSTQQEGGSYPPSA